ncbi:hypothetical protein ANT_00340 [Anaerolinea thermophila UNI-1]|uniref:Uncharacterized protein n=2 Tax=Anaerolinea thermophila TaxID=167964 RepID=E8MYC3_ANATU|nr:hypothetical protein ANT_00340 [Anaerolinea thermophila UNI-1]
MCYTLTMQAYRAYWHAWAQTLQRWGLNEFAAALLEGAAPLSILMGQVITLSQPLLGAWVSTEKLEALAHLCEDDEERIAFASFLREENTT